MADFTIPMDRWATPTVTDLSENAEYWTGYRFGAGQAQRVLPNPGDFAKYGADNALPHFDFTVSKLEMTPAMRGYPNALTVGYNQALWDGADALWRLDPNSPHNKPV